MTGRPEDPVEQTCVDPLFGEQVVLRGATLADAARLREILAEPEVERWWGRRARDTLADDLLGTDRTIRLAIEFDGDVVGLIQYAEIVEPEYRSASIDLFLSAAVRGRGLGPDAVRMVARYLIDVLGHHRLTIDPATDNTAAIAAYTKVGFQPVGIMRQYERIDDGDWHDSLLMDLLVDDLT